MNTREFLKLSPEELAKKQFEVLKQKVVERLDEISSNIEKNNFDKIFGMLAYSPAGDDHGADNEFIYFGDIDESCIDINDVLKKINQITRNYQVIYRGILWHTVEKRY